MDESVEREDVIALLASLPENLSDLLTGIEPTQAAYRHGPAFPTITELVNHITDSAAAADAVLRHTEGAPDDWHSPPPSAEPRSVNEALSSYRRVRRKLMEVLNGWNAEEWADARETCTAIAAHEAAHLSQVRNLLALMPEAKDLGPAPGEPALRRSDD